MILRNENLRKAADAAEEVVKKGAPRLQFRVRRNENEFSKMRKPRDIRKRVVLQLARLRDNGMPAQKIADGVGAHVSTIHAWLHGRHKPGHDKVQLIQKFLDTHAIKEEEAPIQKLDITATDQ